MKLRTFLLGFASLLVAACAAFFSVTGLSKLFAGASLEVMIMAGSLEFAKIITASFLYAYWHRISKILKTYLTFGVVILVLITSLGIYGFLTSAYQTTADELSVMDSRIAVIELRKEQYQSQLDLAVGEREGINQSITSLTGGLSNAVNQTVDRQTGQLVTNVSTASQRAISGQLTEARNRQDVISSNIVSLSDSIGVLNQQILEIKSESTVAGEVGPLRYLSDISGMEMNMIVNLFALLIVFVFDPLAVSLVIAFNAAIKLDKEEKFNDGVKKHEYKIYGDDSRVEVKSDKVEPLPVVNKVILSSENEPITNVVETDITEPDELLELTQDISRRPIDTDGDGIIDGYDTDGDGLIDEFKPGSASRYRYAKDKLPFYARREFDWSDREKWIYNQNAVNYYLTNIAPTMDSKYPTDFDSKTY
jgi:hypothetical protein